LSMARCLEETARMANSDARALVMMMRGVTRRFAERARVARKIAKMRRRLWSAARVSKRRWLCYALRCRLRVAAAYSVRRARRRCVTVRTLFGKGTGVVAGGGGGGKGRWAPSSLPQISPASFLKIFLPPHSHRHVIEECSCPSFPLLSCPASLSPDRAGECCPERIS